MNRIHQWKGRLLAAIVVLAVLVLGGIDAHRSAVAIPFCENCTLDCSRKCFCRESQQVSTCGQCGACGPIERFEAPPTVRH
jgi:hypothetical protein